MKQYLNNLRKPLTSASALLLLWIIPAMAHAGSIGFCNETTSPVLVQGASVVNGMIRLGPRMVIYPNRTAHDLNLAAGQRQIFIRDPNVRGRLLLRQTIQFDGADQVFSIRVNPLRTPFPLRLQRRK